MKAVPNIISSSRIVLSLSLFFVKPLSAAFYIIYTVCGFSDMIDGFIARKTGTTSKLGEKLDSLADLVMAGVLIIIFYPIINPDRKIIFWVISIGVIRLISMSIALKKYRIFTSLHTYGNKATGMILLIFPIVYIHIQMDILTYMVCIVASISAIEELIIQLISNELQVNRQSLFTRPR